MKTGTLVIGGILGDGIILETYVNDLYYVSFFNGTCRREGEYGKEGRAEKCRMGYPGSD
jgi:hypothetical protein